MATIKVSGNFARLRTLTNKVKDLVGAGPLTALNTNLAEEALYQVRQEFRGQRDPYDDGWAPLKHRRGRILRDTGRLANSFSRVSVSRKGFVIASGAEYASVHQYGAKYTAPGGSTSRNKRGRIIPGSKLLTKTGRLRKGFKQVSHGAYQVEIPARPMLPLESRGLGGRWTEALAKVTRRAVSRLLKG